MTAIGVSMMRDEADVVAGTIRHMAGEVDRLVVADNRSIDGTRDILHALAAELPLTVLDDLDPGYDQGAKMSALADKAADGDASIWIVPFDADEIWYSPMGRVGDVLEHAGHLGACRAYASLWDHYRTALDVNDPDPFRAMVWRWGDQAPLPKMAFRWQPGARIAQGNHNVDLISPGGAATGLLHVRHFPWRSFEQMVRKVTNGAEAYEAAPELPDDMGAHWRGYARILREHGPDVLRTEVYERYFSYLSPISVGMAYDPPPYRRRWQE